MTKNARLLFRLLLLILAVVVALGAGEILAMALKLAPPFRRITVSFEDHESIYRRSDNPILGYELKPDYYNPSPDHDFTCERINAHGQRDIERTIAKPPGVRRVILLGDSIVESTEISDVNDVMNRELEKLYPDGKTEVLNFGVGGYCTLAEVELLRVKGLKFEPDIVIVVFFWNDFENFNSSIVEALADKDVPSPAFRALFARSHLFRATLVSAGWTSFGMRRDPVVRNKTAIGSNNVVQGLALLRRLADIYGFRPAVAVWPVFEDDAITEIPFMPDGTTLIVEPLARAVGIPCFRLAPAFRQHYAATKLGNGPKLAYTVGDGWHPNETGSTVAALALKEVVAAVGGERAVPSAAGPFTEDAVAAAEFVAQRTNARWQDMSDALIGEARCLQASYPEKSLQHLQDAVRLRPDDPDLLAELAVMQAATGDLQAALAGFRKAAELAPDKAGYRISAATILSTLGRDEEALPLCREAAALEPEKATVWQTWGVILRKLDRQAEAIEKEAKAAALL
ncbi:MAG: hypothetical protein HN383_09955 [Verrucomicrobia bacterium]|jgi:lysophospholipase L1-like esterase|nr:hypothetical protein [Verrucomicrobiota bacterium]MBT7702371.1 hypothetical protein [Verrucomicrobiota bacterium]